MTPATMIGTKISTKTKVAIAIAVAAGALAIANAILPLVNKFVISSPTSGATVAGTVKLGAKEAPTGTASLRFDIVGPKGVVAVTVPGVAGSSGAWAAQWDSTAVPDGDYAVRAAALPQSTKLQIGTQPTLTPSVSFKVKNATAPPPPSSVCGDGLCAADETNASCPADCPLPPTGSMTYTLAPDDTDSEAGLEVSGSQHVLAKFRLTASGEELQQTKLRISLAVPANRANVQSVSLYDGSTLIGGPVAVDASGNAGFTGLSLTVPQDASKTLTVKAMLMTVAAGGASGKEVTLVLHVPSTDDGSFEYRGAASGGIREAQSGGDVLGRRKIAVKTKPTVSLAPLPSSTLNAGTVVASRFTVTADAGEQVGLKKLAFKSVFSGMSSASATFALREVGMGSSIAASALMTASGSDCGFTASVTDRCVRVTLNDEQTVAAGTSKTYELLVTLTGSLPSGSMMSTTILGDATWKYGTFSAVNSSAAQSNFVWSDNAAVPHASTSADWADGAYVKVLPSDPQTLFRP